MRITARNLLDIDAPYSYLSTSISSGGTIVPVKNSNAFSPSNAIQIGKTGEETTEILMLGTSAISNGTLETLSTLRFSHPIDTPVYNIKFDKIIFKRSASGTSGTAIPFSNSTVSIQPDSKYTICDDTSGQITYAYRATYYNSATGEESQTSDWITASGYSFYSLAKIRERVKRKLFSADYIIEDEVIDDWINEWLEQMSNTAMRVNQDYMLGSVNIAFGTTGLGTIALSDFREIKRMWVNYGGEDRICRPIDSYLVDPNATYSEYEPKFAYFGDDTFIVYPHTSGGTAKILYYKKHPYLSNDSDEIPVIMRNYTSSFVDYAVAEAKAKDDKDKTSEIYRARAFNAKEQFARDITPRTKSEVSFIEFVEPVYGEDT